MQGRVGRGVWRQPGSCLSVTCPPSAHLTPARDAAVMAVRASSYIQYSRAGSSHGVLHAPTRSPTLCLTRSASSAYRWSWLMITVRLRALVNELLCSGITHTLRTSSDKWASQPGQETSLSISESEPWPTALVSSLSIHVGIHTQLWRALREFK